MKRIGLSQRVDTLNDLLEIRDCLDHNWADLLSFCGFLPIPLCNNIKDIETYLDQVALDGLILTGGNDLAVCNTTNASETRDRFELGAITYCSKNQIPVFGVCRGMQVINVWCGGSLKAIEGHVGSIHDITVLDKKFADGVGRIEVNSFHSFGISESGLGNKLVPLALDEQGFIEAALEKEKNFLGVMWHPERVNPFNPIDYKMIKLHFANR